MIRKLEGILAEKEKHLDNYNQSKQKHDSEISELKAILEEERRKSTVDADRIRHIQEVLGQKIKQANEETARLNSMSRKSEKDNEEIIFLRDLIEKERKKSTADETLIKKL